MEKGQIKNVCGPDGGGKIADAQGQLISYSSGSLVGRGRGNPKQGDSVWFERASASGPAINVRLC